MKKNSFENWAVAIVTMLVVVVIFSAITTALTTFIGGNFIKNGVTLGLIGVCASFWYYAGTKQAPLMIKVLATVVTIMVSIVIYGMYFLV